MFSKAQQPQQTPSAKAQTPFFKPEATFKPLATEQQATTERAPETIMRLPIQSVQRQPNAPARAQTSNFKPQTLTHNLPIQAKLTVGQPNDKYEQEADAMADKVIQRWAMPNVTRPSGRDAQQTPTITPFNINAVQAKCAACEKGDKDHLQRKESGEMTASPSVESRLSATKGGGSPLPESTRSEMGAAIGADFSNVRIHTGGEAVQLSQDLSAHAFTHGSDVYFNSGKFSPHTEGGRHLLAHELVHTVQQGNGVQRSLQRFVDPHSVCFSSGHTAALPNATACAAWAPENCATYERWLMSFQNFATFGARDTAPMGVVESRHRVIGSSPAVRSVDSLTTPITPPVASPQSPPTLINPTAIDNFIDHPTADWVKTCLPQNLHIVAYQLPADCADIAVVLRHVWLAAHNRTQVIRINAEHSFTIGHAATGQAETRAAAQAMDGIGSINVGSVLNAYSNVDGTKIRSFQALKAMLHPGDILVWEHRVDSPTGRREGGHTQTIVNIERSGDAITSIGLLQGNQPLGRAQATEINAYQRLHHQPLTNVDTIRAAPGRRIEAGSLNAANQLHTSDFTDSQGRRGEGSLWTWHDGHTVLVAAGPPSSAQRPAVHGRHAQRNLTDWNAPLQRATTVGMLEATFEAALLELRSMIEGGQTVTQDMSNLLGATTGLTLWNLARNAHDLGEISHFRPILRFIAIIDALANPSNQAGLNNPLTTQFNGLKTAFEAAARGTTSIDFPVVAESVQRLRFLVTGFDPFDVNPVPAGRFNPSGALALALDNTHFMAGTTRVDVQGIVLPVDMNRFSTGLVENIVRPLIQRNGVDAIISLGVDSSLEVTDAVRLERMLVGVHQNILPDVDSPIQAIEVPLGTRSSPAIIESPMDLATIAANSVSPQPHVPQPNAPQPTVGTAIGLRFDSNVTGNRALTALGTTAEPNQPELDGADLVIRNLPDIQHIIATMQIVGTTNQITFDISGQAFQAGIIEAEAGNFLCNEMSYRVLHLLSEQGRQASLPSFFIHVHNLLDRSNNAGITIRQNTKMEPHRQEEDTQTAIANLEVLTSHIRRIIMTTAETMRQVH
jgi:pyrrolidone-carboxylate peptidase